MEGDEESSPGSDLITAERKADKNAVHAYLDVIWLIMKQQERSVEGVVEEAGKPDNNNNVTSLTCWVSGVY